MGSYYTAKATTSLIERFSATKCHLIPKNRCAIILGVNTEQLTLRQLVNARLDELEQEIEAARVLQEFSQLKLQVGQLSEATQELEGRVNQLERHKSMASWIARQAVTVAVIVVIVWLLGVMR